MFNLINQFFLYRNSYFNKYHSLQFYIDICKIYVKKKVFILAKTFFKRRLDTVNKHARAKTKALSDRHGIRELSS